MAWISISDAVNQKLGTRASLHRHAKAGKLPNYKDSDGRVLIWSGDSQSHDLSMRLTDIVEQQQTTIQELAEQLKILTAQNTKPTPAKKARAAQRKRRPQPLRIEGVISGDDAELLNGLSELEMSAHKIEKKAGTWNGAISKLRKGKLAPGNVKARAALRALLNSQQNVQAKSA